jgi:hypothetical protein
MLGKQVIGARYEQDVHAIVEGRDALAMTLDVEHPTAVSSVQVLFWFEDGIPRVGRPQSSQPVHVQSWGQAQRHTPLATAPQGERLEMLTTLWLPISNVDKRNWRWRIGVINPLASWPGPVPGRWGTSPEISLTQPTEDQLEMLLIRYADFLHFPARARKPLLRAGSNPNSYESRLRRIHQLVRAATSEDPGRGEELLATLIDHGAVRLIDVIQASKSYGIELRNIEALAQLEDPRPTPRVSRHPNARRLRPLPPS